MPQDLSHGGAGAAWLGLAGRVCVVTGAGNGIGAETARQLAQVGAHVALLDRDEPRALTVAAEIVAAGGRALGLGADITSRAQIEAAAVRVERELGRCRVLVNNAAVQYVEPLMRLDMDKWRQALDVNLNGAVTCTQVFGQQMIAGGQGGSIVSVGSICGGFARPNGGAYSVSKAGLAMLSRQLSLELAEHRIRCNVVAPGFVKTALSEKIYRDADTLRKRMEMVPAGRIGETRDIADAIVYLASERAAYVNGQTLYVDGGLGETLMTLVPRPPPA